MKRFPFPYKVKVVSGNSLSGANATHKFGFIWIRDSLRFALPILGQEIHEEDYLWSRLYLPLFFAVFGFITYAHLTGLFAATIPVLAGGAALSFSLSMIIRAVVPFIRQNMELRGHAIEATWACDYLEEGLHSKFRYLDGMTQDGYWLSEAIALANYGQFSNWGQAEIVSGLNSYRTWARKWVDANKESLTKKYKDRLPKDLVHQRI